LRALIVLAILTSLSVILCACPGKDQAPRPGESDKTPGAFNGDSPSPSKLKGEGGGESETSVASFRGSDATGELRSSEPTPKIEVTITPEKPALALGEMTVIRLEVANRGKNAIRCAEVVHDILSAYLEIGFDETVAEYIRIQKEYFSTILEKSEPSPYLQVITLGPGEKASTSIRFLLPRAGTFRIRGVYRGFGPSNLLFHRSEWAEILVSPQDGANTLRALVNTDQGEMEFAFHPREALATTIHFLTLVTRRFYDTNIRFHRVQKDFVIQTGDPGDTGLGGPGFFIPQEFSRRPHLEGALSMFRRTSHVDTAGSQFFICLHMDPENQKALDGQYTIFGYVAKGYETARKIGAVAVDSRMMPIEPIRITSMTVVKR
jgi:cyclophilin family peptidyl-prolyl cis-trans isomerase